MLPEMRRLLGRYGAQWMPRLPVVSSARRDEMIKTSGYRVSPTEVEEAIYATQRRLGDARRSAYRMRSSAR